MSQRRRSQRLAAVLVVLAGLATGIFAQSAPDKQILASAEDEDFARQVKEWTTRPDFISPLVDHLPKVAGIPSPKDVLGHHIGAPKQLTYYADILEYYRALAAAMTFADHTDVELERLQAERAAERRRERGEGPGWAS